MAIREILLLGNPGLLTKREPILSGEIEFTKSVGQDLRDSMQAFRAEHGWGRAIAAPQIGIKKQIVFMEVHSPILFINPVISEPSTEMMEIWDDCMSFPQLMIKILRHRSCKLNYFDEDWQEQTITVNGDLSQLLQHEIDHLNGILATMRAIDGTCFALKSQRHLLG